MAKLKRKTTRKPKPKKKKGGRVEAYTYGEALRNPKWPF